MNLQDAFLNQVRVAKTPVIVNLIGGQQGQQLKGIVKGFDNFVIMLELSGKDNLIYKHAVSTITPQSQIAFFNSDEKKSSYIEGENA